MKVRINCKLNKRFPGVVYGTVICADELLINATLSFCIEACKQRGYTVENGQDVLEWLSRNAEFKGNPVC